MNTRMLRVLVMACVPRPHHLWLCVAGCRPKGYDNMRAPSLLRGGSFDLYARAYKSIGCELDSLLFGDCTIVKPSASPAIASSLVALKTNISVERVKCEISVAE